jgi:hypothetical protein
LYTLQKHTRLEAEPFDAVATFMRVVGPDRRPGRT